MLSFSLEGDLGVWYDHMMRKKNRTDLATNLSGNLRQWRNITLGNSRWIYGLI